MAITRYKGFLIGAVLLIPFTLQHNQILPSLKYTLSEVRCLAQNIHFEARGESLKGKVAVAFVTLNRSVDRKFPGSICKVVHQPGQFSWVDQIPNYKKVKIPTETSQLAFDILDGKYKDPTKGALYFHNDEAEAFDRKEISRIGNHVFYK